MSDEQPPHNIECPFCSKGFDYLSNAEAVTPVKCPHCAHHFHVLIKLGEPIQVIMSPEDMPHLGEEEELQPPEEEPNFDGFPEAPQEDERAYK